MSASYEDLRQLSAAHGQDHLFQYWDELDETHREKLLQDVSDIDFPLLEKLILTDPAVQEGHFKADQIHAPAVCPANPGPDRRDQYEEARRCGEELLSSSRVAAMVVAGGQGTRLGFDGPKGTFSISPIEQKTLFQLFAESILAVCRRFDCRLPWYIMTSEATDEETRHFFAECDYFGLDHGEVSFFKQGVVPAVDRDGRILLSARHQVALSPNGHGGSLTAMRDSGVLADMRQRGVEAISYFQVDNPLVSPADPLFIGLHQLAGSQISSIAVAKADDLEKVGNFVEVGGKLRIIEYSDLPNELAHARNVDGSRMLNAGNVAIHLLSREFVEELTAGGELELPWHVANKKVSYVDPASGAVVSPDRPNARKFEMFIFDAIPLAEVSIVLEQLRSECFSPVKNPKGVDSAETARRDMIHRAISWLEQCGVNCPRTPDGSPDAIVEISPLLALDAKQLKQNLPDPCEVNPGETIYLG